MNKKFRIIRSGLLVLFLLVPFLSSCYKIPYYEGAKSPYEIDFGSGLVYIQLFHMEFEINASKSIVYKEDSTYSEFEKGLLEYRDVPFDSSLFYLRVSHEIWKKTNMETPNVFMTIDSIVITPNFEKIFPQIKLFEQWLRVVKSRTKVMHIEQIVVPKAFKNDFEIDYVLSIFKESDSVLVLRTPIKLKAERKKRIYSPIYPGT